MKTLLRRRDFLKLGTIGVAISSVTIANRGRLFAQPAEAGSGLIVRTETPYNAEPPLERLVEKWLTPTSAFFERSHGKVPILNDNDFAVTVDGMVDRPLELKLPELTERFPVSSLTATLTCAGNRRTEFNRIKKVPGVQWESGAIGNAEWQGVRLSDVLKMAGITSGAKHIWFEGLDQITDKGETFPFGGSIPLEKAMSDTESIPGCLLAMQMNGKPLSAGHGFPLRTIVPGFIGARSVKWLSKITISDRPSANHYLAHAYKLISEDTHAAVEAADPIYEYILNSIICTKGPTPLVPGSRVTIKGVAISGGRSGERLNRVEISVDGGDTWLPTTITSPVRDFCWIHWSAEISLTAKTESILVRATGSSGESQPRETPWNVKGYQYNGWHKVDLTPA